MTADVHRPPPVSVSEEQIWPRINVTHSGLDATTSLIEDDTFEPYYQQKSPLSSTKSSKSRLSWLPFRRRGSSTRKSTSPRSATSNQSTPNNDDTRRLSMESPRNIDTQHVVDIPSRDRAQTTLVRATSDGPQQARQPVHQPTYTQEHHHHHHPPQRNSINHHRSQTMITTSSRPIPSAMRQPQRLQHERIVTFDANPLPAAYVVLAHDWDLVSSAITDEEELNVSRSRATTQVIVSTRLKTTTPLRRISLDRMSIQSSLPIVTSVNSTTMSTKSSPVTSTTTSATHSKQTSMSISPRGRSQTTLSSSSPSTSEPASPEESRNQPDSARSISSTTPTSTSASTSPPAKVAVTEITKRRKWYHRLFRTMPRNSKPSKIPTPATPVA